MKSVTDEDYDPDEHEPLPEGEEAPPPLVHTMAMVRWMLFAGMSVFALVMVLGYFGLNPLASQTSTAAQYNCPMHPTYISNQPGDCPICGMSLVPIKDNATDTTMAMQDEAPPPSAKPGQYTCPMHPEIVSDTPGRCPECNMRLEKVPEARVVYTCPMHPEVVSDTPGECPKCGMDLVKKTDEHAGQEMSGMGEALVPGLVPVTIEAQRLQLIGLKTATAERRDVVQSLRLVGLVAPDETRLASLNVRTSGWVQELFVNQTGQWVERGQALLSVYSQELYEAQRDFIVARDAASSVSSDTLLGVTRRQLLVAARERLRLLGLSGEEITPLESSDIPSPQLVLRSPFSGYVLDKAVVQGQFVTPSQPLLSLADLSRVWVLADVYEPDIGMIHKGQMVTASVASYPGEKFEGTVGFIYPSVSEKTRTMKVRVELDNRGMRLRPGMYAEVELQPEGGATLAVPAEALMDGGETQYVFVVHGADHFEPRMVTVGRRSDDWIEIVAGVSEGETVVTSANFLIDSESRLKAAIVGMGSQKAGAHEGHGQ